MGDPRQNGGKSAPVAFAAGKRTAVSSGAPPPRNTHSTFVRKHQDFSVFVSFCVTVHWSFVHTYVFVRMVDTLELMLHL